MLMGIAIEADHMVSLLLYICITTHLYSLYHLIAGNKNNTHTPHPTSSTSPTLATPHSTKNTSVTGYKNVTHNSKLPIMPHYPYYSLYPQNHPTPTTLPSKHPLVRGLQKCNPTPSYPSCLTNRLLHLSSKPSYPHYSP